MFMGPCIFIYEDHINNQRDATIFCSLLIAILYMFRASLAHHQEDHLHTHALSQKKLENTKQGNEI